jgi:hypothetical protein
VRLVRLAGVVAVVAVLAWSHWRVYRAGDVNGRAAITAQWNEERLAQSKAALTLIERRDRTQADLQTNADNQRRIANAKMRALDAQLAAAVDGLRQRAEHPATGGVAAVSSTATAAADAGPAGCTGAGLYAADAEFLVRESARADGFKARAESCEAAYSAARDAIAAWQKSVQP